MMNRDDSAWLEGITPYRLQRLMKFELMGRVNETIVELFDWWTDLAFIAVCWVFSQPGEPSDSLFNNIAATSFSGCTGSSPMRNFDFYYRLFITGACILVFNVIVRLGIALSRLRYRREINGWKEWSIFAVGTIVTIIEPHNGALVLDSVLDESSIKESDYASTKLEVNMNILLLMIEDGPQFILQILFFVRTAEGNLPVAWYISTLVTVLHLLSSVTSIVLLTQQLSTLRAEGEARITGA